MRKRLCAGILVIVLLLAALFVGLRTRYPVRYLDIIRREQGRLDTATICAVIHAESTFRPNALSKKNAMGLMQLTEGTARWMADMTRMDNFDTNLLYTPEVNITLGCYFLNWLLNYYDDDITLALCAYNAGMGNVDRWLNDERYAPDGVLGKIPFPETERYLKRVKTNKMIYDFLLFFN